LVTANGEIISRINLISGSFLAMSKARAAKGAEKMGAKELPTQQRRKAIMLAEMEMETTNDTMDKVLKIRSKALRRERFDGRGETRL
jgi:hypothetical protein